MIDEEFEARRYDRLEKEIEKLKNRIDFLSEVIYNHLHRKPTYWDGKIR